ncbi:beta-lactamase [Mangrovibacter sp. MFB070]|uniref:MBL fold metallo-hydrolase n=1 Tax=Mangrovibacter sp. MFB070 TaxID=1224318 RepID=UPI0004D85E12|nr:MBL fold metallo-hydrolase [Mangrovibacter sp. MFB070]KEA52983.1 beta-lactamase [Mangrovibacter sp. MFB070]
MTHINKTYQVGDITVTRIDEMRLNTSAVSFLYPDSTQAEAEENAWWLTPADMDATNHNLVQSIHSWLVRTPHHTILIDTGAGNTKPRPRNPIFDNLNTPYLHRLAAAGVRPQDVDYVLHTHLHVDHVGWNTQWVDGRWQPTFPNARHVFSQAEEDYYGSPESHNEVNTPSFGVFEDSVAPIIAAGQAERIGNDGGTFLDNFEFHPTRGHSIGHMSIELSSRGQSALFTGDVMNHQLQVVYPHWNTVFCEWQDDARISRRRVLEQSAEQHLLLFTSHFAQTSAGYVSRLGDGFTWHYE